MCKRNSSQTLVPVDSDWPNRFHDEGTHPHQTETLRDADLDHQSQRIRRLLMRWYLCLPVKNLFSSFLQDAEISAFELRSILNKILAKRKYLPPAGLPAWLWEILTWLGLHALQPQGAAETCGLCPCISGCALWWGVFACLLHTGAFYSSAWYRELTARKTGWLSEGTW